MLLRGEVWWVDLGERRPVVLLQEGANGEFHGIQIVEPADTTIAGIALEVRVGAADGLPLEGVVRVALPRPGLVPCTWLATVTELEASERAGVLQEAKLVEIGEALRRAEISFGS